MFKKLFAWMGQTRGVGLAETIIVVGLIAIGTLGGVSVFGDDLRGLFSASDNALAGDEHTTPATRPSDVELEKNLKNFASNRKAGTPGEQPSTLLSQARQALNAQGAQDGSNARQPEFKYDEQKAQAALKLALATGKARPDWKNTPNFDPDRIAGMEGFRSIQVASVGKGKPLAEELAGLLKEAYTTKEDLRKFMDTAESPSGRPVLEEAEPGRFAITAVDADSAARALAKVNAELTRTDEEIAANQQQIERLGSTWEDRKKQWEEEKQRRLWKAKDAEKTAEKNIVEVTRLAEANILVSDKEKEEIAQAEQAAVRARDERKQVERDLFRDITEVAGEARGSTGRIEQLRKDRNVLIDWQEKIGELTASLTPLSDIEREIFERGQRLAELRFRLQLQIVDQLKAMNYNEVGILDDLVKEITAQLDRSMFTLTVAQPDERLVIGKDDNSNLHVYNAASPQSERTDAVVQDLFTPPFQKHLQGPSIKQPVEMK